MPTHQPARIRRPRPVFLTLDQLYEETRLLCETISAAQEARLRQAAVPRKPIIEPARRAGRV